MKYDPEIDCCDDIELHEDKLKLVHTYMPAEEKLYDLAELFKVLKFLSFYMKEKMDIKLHCVQMIM